MPAPDWLEGLGGAFGGITKGLTAGMEPFSAYEKVRSADLANDRSDIALRDFLAQQTAREELPGYYGAQAGAADVAHRLASSKGEKDIFGFDQALAGSRYMADPNDAFQQTVQALGLQPTDPEYRKLALEAMSYYDPQGAMAASDKMNIPGLEQKNVSKQALLQYITERMQEVDAGAQAIQKPDGSFAVVGSDGQEIPLDADTLAKAADMMGPTGVMGTVNRGITQSIALSNANNATYKALQEGRVPPAQQQQALNRLSIDMGKEISTLLTEKKALDANFMMDPAEKEAQLADINKRGQAAVKRKTQIDNALMSVAGGQPAGRAGLPATPVQGRSTVTAPPRPPPGALAARAAGGGARGPGGAPMQAPWGASAAGGGAYPTPQTAEELGPFLQDLFSLGVSP